MPEEWTLMTHRCDDGLGKRDWMSIVAGPVVGNDGETFAVVRRSEAERETVRRITAWLRARADRWSAGDVGVPVLYEAAAAIDRKFGGEDKGGEPQ